MHSVCFLCFRQCQSLGLRLCSEVAATFERFLSTHWRLVRRPGDEDPLVSLSVLRVQAVEDVAGLLRCEQRQQELVVIPVPALRWLSTPVQHQLLCGQNITRQPAANGSQTPSSLGRRVHRFWWRSSLFWWHLPLHEPESPWAQMLLRKPDKADESTLRIEWWRCGMVEPENLHLRENIRVSLPVERSNWARQSKTSLCSGGLQVKEKLFVSQRLIERIANTLCLPLTMVTKHGGLINDVGAGEERWERCASANPSLHSGYQMP